MEGTMKKPQKAKKGTFGRLVKILFKEFKWQLILVMICIVITSFGNLASSIFVKNITDALTDAIKAQTDPW